MSNLDQIFGLKESDPLVAMNPLLLLGCVLAAIAIGWLCAKLYENTSDFKKSVRLSSSRTLSCPRSRVRRR